MSYGGSSVLTTLLAVGLLQSIHVQARTSRKGLDSREEASARRASTAVRPASRCSRRRTDAKDYRVAELYLERRGQRSIVGNVYKGKVDNVLPGPRGGVRRHRPRQERLPARRRDRAARGRDAAARPRQGGRQEDHRPPQAGPGDHRAGRQGPAEDEGRPAVDGADDRRPLHGLRPDGRGHRRLQAPRRQGARAPAQGGQGPRHGRRRRDRPHRGAGRQAGGLRARAAVPPQALRGPAASAPTRPWRPTMVFQEADLSVRVVRDIFSADFERAIVDDAEAAPAADLVLHPHRPRARRPASSSTRTRSRCSRSSASRRSSRA